MRQEGGERDGGSRDLPQVTPSPSARDQRGGTGERGPQPGVEWRAQDGGAGGREDCSAFSDKTVPHSLFSTQLTPGCSKHPVRSRGKQQQAHPTLHRGN